MIFPSLTLETVVQIEDKMRLDASLSFISGDVAEVITDVLIQPEATDSFISVYDATDSDNWYLDWAYITNGTKTVLVRVETDLTPAGRTKTYSIDALDTTEDSLFSGDPDLFPFEPDLKTYLPQGKNSFLYVHRKAQDKIIAYLDEQRIWKLDGSRYSKQDLAGVTDDEIRQQFNMWSTFETLLIIMESVQVSNADIFQAKRLEYEALRNQARNRSALRLDADGDNVIDSNPYDIRTLRMIRR